VVIPKEGALYILKEEFYETKPAWWPFVSTPWPVFMEPCLAGEQAALLAGVRASSGLPSFAHPLHRRPPGPVSRCGDRRTAGGAGSGSTSALSIASLNIRRSRAAVCLCIAPSSQSLELIDLLVQRCLR